MKVNPAGPDATIIIFGAAVRPDGKPSQTLRHRVAAAARLGARFDRPRFIPTGGRGRYGETQASVMASLLVAAGFEEMTIVPEETGTDTLSSVRAVVRLIDRRSTVY